MFTSKDKAVEFIYSSYMRAVKKIPKNLPDYKTRSPHLTRILLDNIGSPDKKQNNILVTGSKGKGSISRILSKLLQDQGYRVGLFTSPHLIDFNERIRINGVAISDEDFIEYVNKIFPYVREIEEKLEDDKYIGPVGITAAISSLYFLDNKTDFNVIECGRGARYDDVSMLESIYSVINTVFLEHVPEVGSNLEEIAYNKSGVIKKTQKAVYTAKQIEDVAQVIEKVSEELKVPLRVYERDFYSENIQITSKGTVFDVNTRKNKYTKLQTSLLGRHQTYNIALCIALLEEILKIIDEDKIRKSLWELSWPGRLEIIDKSPLTILDGCINRECAKYVKEVIEEINEKPVITIFGIPDNKDFEGVFQVLSGLSDKMIVTRASNEHLYFTDIQYQIAKKYNTESYYTNNIEEAVNEAKQNIQDKGMICIIGTQSLIRDTKLLYKQSTKDLK